MIIPPITLTFLMFSRFISVLGKIGLRGNPFDVCFDIDDCWFSGRKGLIQRTGKLTGFVDNDTKTSHCLRNFGKVDGLVKSQRHQLREKIGCSEHRVLKGTRVSNGLMTPKSDCILHPVDFLRVHQVLPPLNCKRAEPETVASLRSKPVEKS